MVVRVFKILGLIFFAIGMIVSVVLGIVSANIINNHNRIAQDGIPVTATIAEIGLRRNISSGFDDDFASSSTYSMTVIIEYTVGGTTVRAPLNWSSSNMRVGQNIEIIVSRTNLHEFVSVGFWQQYWSLVLPGIGMIFVVLGAIFLIVARRKHSNKQWLFEHGKPVWATVQGTEENWNVRINGRPMTVLVATYGAMRFVSDGIKNRDLANIGQHVKVLIHPDNPDRYAFDFHDESPLRPSDPPEQT